MFSNYDQSSFSNISFSEARVKHVSEMKCHSFVYLLWNWQHSLDLCFQFQWKFYTVLQLGMYSGILNKSSRIFPNLIMLWGPNKISESWQVRLRSEISRLPCIRAHILSFIKHVPHRRKYASWSAPHYYSFCIPLGSLHRCLKGNKRCSASSLKACQELFSRRTSFSFPCSLYLRLSVSLCVFATGISIETSTR